MITSNGFKIYNLNNKLIFINNLDEKIALMLCKIVYQEPDIVTKIHQNNQWYINNQNIKNEF